MASTWTFNKAVSAFVAPSGETYYCLHECSSSSNVFPQEYPWGVIAIGTLETVMQRIFEIAAYTEGGMVAGYEGRPLTPEGYIRLWMAELARPVAHPHYAVRLQGLASSPKAQAWFEILVEAGYQEQVTALQAGGCADFDLALDIHVLERCFNRECGTAGILHSACRFSPPCFCPALDLAYEPAGTRPIKVHHELKIITMDAGRDQRDAIVLRFNGEIWETYAHSRVDAVARYVSELYAHELRYPHTYNRSIQDFRQSLAVAEILDLTELSLCIPYDVAIKHSDLVGRLRDAYMIEESAGVQMLVKGFDVVDLGKELRVTRMDAEYTPGWHDYRVLECLGMGGAYWGVHLQVKHPVFKGELVQRSLF